MLPWYDFNIVMQIYGTFIENLWKQYGNSMEVLWKLYGSAMEMPWKFYGKTNAKIFDMIDKIDRIRIKVIRKMF